MRMNRIASLLASFTLAAAAAAYAQNAQPTFVVIAMGDSYASGEGDPEVPGDYAVDGQIGTAEKWTDTSDVTAFNDAWRCHRSPGAGAARAVDRLRQAFPGITFVFASFACSGAKASTGILEPYEGADNHFKNDPPLPPQLDQADAFLDTRPTRQVDAIVMNIGGNDAGFGQMIFDCLFLPDVPVGIGVWRGCESNEGTRQALDAGIAALGGADGLYAQMNEQITERLAPRRVYITEVPNPARGSNGALCHRQPALDLILRGATRDEARFIESSVVAGLNRAFREAAASMEPEPWTVVDGIADAYRTHGICSADSWFRSNGTALELQGPEIGAHPFRWDTRTLDIGVISAGFLHPNAAGYAAIGERIASALETQVRAQFTITESPRLALDSISSPRTSGTAVRGVRIASPARTRRPTGTFALSWTNPAPDATTKFVLTVNGRESEVPGGTTRHVVHADGRIVAEIRACGPLGCGPVSARLEATNVIPATPTALRKATSPGTTAWSGVLPLTWSAADQHHEYFEVSYRREGATLAAAQPASGRITRPVQPVSRRSATGEAVVRAPTSSYQIGSPNEPLPSGASFVVKVRACSSAGCSEWTPEITAQVGGNATRAPAPRPPR